MSHLAIWTPALPPRARLTCGALLLSLIFAPAAPASAQGLLPATQRAFPPALPVTDGVNVAALRTGAPVPRPLAQQAQSLFESFLSSAPTGATEIVQVQVRYSYGIGTGGGTATLPVLLSPWAPFSVPGDWSPGVPCQTGADTAAVCRLAADIQAWFRSYSPHDSDAELTFEMTELVPGGDGKAQPAVRAQTVRLPVADVTDL